MCKYLYKATPEQPELSNCTYYMYVLSMIFKEIKGYIKTPAVIYCCDFTVNCNEEIVGRDYFVFFESRYGNIPSPFRKPALAEGGSEVAER